MGYYAAFLDLGDKPCLVVGGGAAATEKAQQLLDAGASVTVLWTSFDPGLQELGDAGRVRLLQRELEEADLQGCCLVIDASGDDDSGARVAAAARRHSVLVNVLDRPALCDFIAPALVRRGR